jgi:hypothetical protein
LRLIKKCRKLNCIVISRRNRGSHCFAQRAIHIAHAVVGVGDFSDRVGRRKTNLRQSQHKTKTEKRFQKIIHVFLLQFWVSKLKDFR